MLLMQTTKRRSSAAYSQLVTNMSSTRQIRILLWKNYKLLIRQPKRIIIELIWPLCLFLILVAVLQTRPELKENIPECHYDGKAMPSAGALPFFQGLICTFSNKCHQTVTLSERPGMVDSWNNSLLSEFFFEIESFLSNQSEVGALVDLLDDLRYLDEFRRNPQMNCTFTLGSVLIDPNKLRDDILKQNISLPDLTIQELLNASLSFSQLINITQYLSWAQELQQNLTGNVVGRNLTQMIEQVHGMVCTDDRTREILWLNTWNMTQTLTSQLCNLTSQEFSEVVLDVVDDLDWNAMLKQLQNCSNREYKFLNTLNTEKMLTTGRAFLDLKSLQSIMSELTSTYKELMDDYRSDSNGSFLNASLLISQLFCGRDQTLILQEESELQKEINEQTKDKEESETINDYVYQNDTTAFCNRLFMNLQKTTATRLLWGQIKPLIRGKLLYTPDTPAVREIIKQANRTFQTLADIKALAQDWLVISPKIEEYIETNPRMDAIRFYVADLSKMETLEDLSDYIQGLFPYSSLIPQVQLNQVLNQLPDWLKVVANMSLNQIPIPQNNLIRDYVVNTMGFQQFKQTVKWANQWLSLDENAYNYTWRRTLNESDLLMITLRSYLDCFEMDKFEGHATEEDLVIQSLSYIENGMFWAGLVFDFEATDEVPGFVPYRIRMPVDRIDTTYKYQVLDRFYSIRNRDNPLYDMKYVVYGFAYIQDMVTHGVIRIHTNLTTDDDIGIFVQQFPYPCYMNAKFVIFISRLIPLLMVLAWIFSVAMIVKGIVYEKEQRLKEVMKVMGLSNSVHWTAWFITCFIMMFISIILLVLTVKVGGVIPRSDWTVLLVFFTIFAMATILQCFMFSVFFSKANIAAACAAIFYFIGYLPYSFCVNWEDVMTAGQKFIACLASTTAFGFGCSYIAKYEEMGEGIHWHNIHESPVIGDNFNMIKVIVIMLVDCVIYWMITWYVEAVKPGEFGVPLVWYFPCTKRYWCKETYRRDESEFSSSIEMNIEQNASIETEPTHLKLGVAIRGLKKVYKKGRKVAVDGLNVNFYEGQITSFLGHNGAGKTTTMSILTGLFPPTEGTAYIYNQDIRYNINEIRKDLGMCPQHNVLFHGMTVEEHIWFYGSLKGVDKQRVQYEIDQLITDVGLRNKRHAQAKDLSGGMKRKLSIAIAFVGGSKVVILDEPTAGVDPYARRSIWDLLLKYKKDRTIILSTHFMDEADILGDRIAIISQGKICCCGTSLFLKAQYGSGYYLTLVKEGEEEARERMATGGRDVRPGSTSSTRTTSDIKDLACVEDVHCDDEGVGDVSDCGSTSNGTDSSNIEHHITSFIRKLIPEAVMVEDIGTELTYQLPGDKDHMSRFEDLFNALDANLSHLRISSYGVSDTTLEEVFLRVAEETGIDGKLGDENTRQYMNQLTDSGNLARPVTRLSFRRNKLSSIFGIRHKKKVTDMRQLMDPDAISEIGPDDDEDISVSADSGISIPTSVSVCSGAGSYTLTGSALIARQFWAQFIKRFHHLRRSKKAFIVQIILPAVFICLAMVFAMVTPKSPNQPSLELHPWRLIPNDYKNLDLHAFYSNDAVGNFWADKFEKLLQETPGVGNRCMDPNTYNISNYPCMESEADSSWTHSSDQVSAGGECSCEMAYQMCPPGAAGPLPPARRLPSTEIMYNMTGRNISDWLLKSHDEFINQRYGGLAFGERDQLVLANSTVLEEALQRLLVAVNGGDDPGIDVNLNNLGMLDNLTDLIDNLATKRNAKVWFNNKGWIAMVSYMNVMNNLILRAHLPPNANPMHYGIAVSNHPMNRTRQQLADYSFNTNMRDVLIAISVIFAMSNVPASFIMFLCEERASKSKHLQFVSGINPVIYWVSNFTWDMLNYLVSAALCVLIMVAFQVQSYVSADNAPCLVSLMFLYGWSVIPMMYPASFLFQVPSTAFVVMSCVNIFIGIVSTLSTFILESFMEEDLNAINAILMKIFLLLPHYCLGRGLIDMTRNQIIADTLAILGEKVFRDPFSWDIVGRNLLAMGCLGPLFFFINLAIQYKFWYYKIPCFKQKHVTLSHDPLHPEDMDVARERRRIESSPQLDDILVLRGLGKVYRKAEKKGRRHAVNNLTLGVRRGECFGLLGINGAGKTTTFKMLTGDTSVTKGDALLAGHSILSDMTSVHQKLGYCPQFDAICPLLTCQEHLELYARLRGVPEPEVKYVAQWTMQKLGLNHYANKCSGELSGGNKRKLSTAISLIGNPPIIFLDEPTTGMDPKARRFLWNCITNIMKDGRSVILTSHSMEECEALCSRLAIMVNGSFQCLGGTQHLKNRFGDGYTLKLRVSGETPDMTSVVRFIENTFQACHLQECHQNMLQYQLGANKTSLADVFGKLEGARDRLHIEDYSVSQTTLDQVFINFAKLQTDMEDDEMIEDMAVPYPSDTLPRGTHVTIKTDNELHGSTIDLLPPKQAAAYETRGSTTDASMC